MSLISVPLSLSIRACNSLISCNKTNEFMRIHVSVEYMDARFFKVGQWTETHRISNIESEGQILFNSLGLDFSLDTFSCLFIQVLKREASN
jgi:hypothetical protein